MKNLKRNKKTKSEKIITILKTKELLNIRGGGDPTQRDIDFD